MCLNHALVSSFSFVYAVLAGNHPEKQLLPFLNRVEKSINSSTVLAIAESAGIIWTAESEEIVQEASGTFIIPIIEGDIDLSMSIMVGISTSGCDTFTIGGGILAVVTEVGVFYPAFAHWGDTLIFSSELFPAGGVIRIPIKVGPTTTRVSVEDLKGGMEWSQRISGPPLDSHCKQEVKWMIATRQNGPLPNFDPVIIRDMEVEASGVKGVPRRPYIVVDNIDHPRIQTSVMFYRDYVVIVYISPPPPG